MRKNRQIWAMFYIVTSVLSIMTGALLSMLIGPLLGISIAATLLISVVSVTIYLGWLTIPENKEAVMEVFGRFEKILTAGPWLIFPYGDWVRIKNKEQLFLGEDFLDLFTEKDAGLVDFTDASGRLISRLYFRIFNSYKASYGVSDVLGSLMESMEGAVRTYFGKVKLDEANQKKVDANLNTILGSPYQDSEIYRNCYDNWGVELLRVVVSDIEISEKDMELRRKLLDAEKELQVAEFTAKNKILIATANKEVLELEGKGIGAQVKHLTSHAGLTEEQAIQYLAFIKKWSAIEKSPSSKLLVDGGSGQVGTGVNLGAGLGLGNSI